jgi:hypothetical protein
MNVPGVSCQFSRLYRLSVPGTPLPSTYSPPLMKIGTRRDERDELVLVDRQIVDGERSAVAMKFPAIQ